MDVACLGRGETGNMAVAIIFGAIGALFLVLGYLLWKKERISLLHQYHYDKVSEEDKKAFCAVSGKGVTVMGAGSLISGVLVGITGSKWSMIAFSVGFLVGLGMLLYAGIRYNQ